MTRVTTAALLSLTLAACAPSTHVTAFKQVAPKRSTQDVEVFTDSRPDRPYEEIGTMEISAGELGEQRYGDLIELARSRAAELGADAIIVIRDPKTRTTGFAYVPPDSKKKTGQLVSASSRTVEVPRIQVAALAWKAAAAD